VAVKKRLEDLRSEKFIAVGFGQNWRVKWPLNYPAKAENVQLAKSVGRTQWQ